MASPLASTLPRLHTQIMTKAIMIQGAGSNVGKSILVAGLARAFSKRGLRVAPFKPQNMSNNAAVTRDGGEIGRAQALQARAAHRDPVTDMNPVLLKPETDIGAQVVVQGKRIATVKARDYAKLKPTLMAAVLDSFHRLASDVDLVLIEGAGSPAEVNLRAGDIANMGFAQAAGVPVALFGDIDRGGVIAQLVGTHVVLPPQDRARITSFGINKFRGDVSLFDDGLLEITRHTGWPSLGVVPWFADAWRLPAEDVMDITNRPGGDLKIAVPRLNRIANFDDLDPLVAEPNVTVEIVEPGRPLPADATLVLIPGSKSTIADLDAFRENGWDIDIAAHVRRGGHVTGICGGYQMLGNSIDDPLGIEGPPRKVNGLGLLDVETVMGGSKHLTQVTATSYATGTPAQGYEIHMGETTGPGRDNPWLKVQSRPEGAVDPTGRIRGAYLHGIYESDAFRAEELARLGSASQATQYMSSVETTLDKLATHLETHLDVDLLLSLATDIGRRTQ